MRTNLTAEELCAQSRLDGETLARLEAVGLLRPNVPHGTYRPKLATWAPKPAYLLAAGWTVAQINIRARAPWHHPDPRRGGRPGGGVFQVSDRRGVNWSGIGRRIGLHHVR